ncbi:MAG: CHASE domain-containing protein [Candidatus Sericytochromatia bacterium]|nr:CHASE domain-containing protein [Candidatus Tanganyikabacteria bacterium]
MGRSGIYLRSLPITLAVLALSAMLAIVAWGLAGNLDHGRERARFEGHVRDAAATIKQRMEAYILALRSGERFISTVGPFTREQWRTFVNAPGLRRDYPGIQGIGFSVRLDDAAQISRLRERLLAEGLPALRIRPPERRSEYHAIIYLEPFDWRNQRAYGYDMFTEPVRRRAMERARDSGRPALSGKVRLVQETAVQPQPGFLVYFPVYRPGMDQGSVQDRRKALLGYVYSPFRAGDFFTAVLGGRLPKEIDFELFDGPDPSSGSLLHDHDPGHVSPALDPGTSFLPYLSTTMPVAIAGHRWTLQANALPAFGSRNPDLPLVVLLAGGIVSVLLAAIALILATGRDRALALAAEMTADLKRADRLKDDFLSVVSHELRTPLNYITGFASVLGDGIAGPLTSRQRDYVQKVLDGARRMLALVNNLLDISLMVAGKLELAKVPFDLGGLVKETVATFEVLAADRGLTLHADTRGLSREVVGDAPRVMQVLTNLVGNAIKYTPRGGCVTLVAADGGGFVRVEVRDDGPGITAEDLPRLFTRFGRVDMSATREAGGIGLGLAISKEIVEAHGGQIGVESRPGAGSTFWFTLPIAGGGEALGIGALRPTRIGVQE